MSNPAPDPGTDHGAERGGSVGNPGGDLRWQSEMSLLGNRFFHADFGKWIGLTLLISAAILVPLCGIPGGADGVQAALLFVGIAAALLILSTLIFVAIMGNRVPMEFTVGADGVRMQGVSRRMKGIHLATVLLGAAARSPSAVGAGAVGMSQQSTTIPWEELRKVRFHPAQRVVFLRGGMFARIRVYCTEQNYAAVEAMVLRHKPAGADVATV